MELKEGMYVKSNLNFINKIIAVCPDREFPYIFKIDDEFCEVYGYKEYQIKKASYDIIDLIEVGDYVNGKKVIDKWEEPSGAFAGQIFIKLDGEDTVPTMRKIETIATKEQFEQIQYRIGD